ncbi:hypothetical protein HJ036_22670 [Vibrio parahaemolyticus]|nr:hypothetical protein [Vibrio parahaemolyticus]HCG8544538.1 hypothetical protein [Vibrio parahaemolyticus]
MKRAILVGSILVLVNGCSTIPSQWELMYGPDKPQYSYILNSKDGSADNSKVGDLMIWNPNTNAAYITEEGKACIQAADVYRVSSASAQASLKADALTSKAANVDASVTDSKVKAAMRLANQDAKGTFLSIALFNMCMLKAHNMLDAQTTELFKHVVTESADLGAAYFDSAPNTIVAGLEE